MRRTKKFPRLMAVINNPTAAIPGHSIKEKAYPHLPIAIVSTPYKPTPEQISRTVNMTRLFVAAPEMFEALRGLIEWASTDRNEQKGTFMHLAEKVVPAAFKALQTALGPGTTSAKIREICGEKKEGV